MQESALSAARATYVVFAGCGFLIASWVARIPQLRDHLGLSPAQLGWMLLGAAAGSLASRPFSGPVLHRFGQRRTVAATSVLAAIGMALVGIGDGTGVTVVVAGLLVIGFTVSVWDVAMNVQGAQVEQALGRSIMPRFHAAFAAGTVAGAGLGAAAVALEVPVTAHLIAGAVAVAVVVPPATSAYLPDPTGDHSLAGTTHDAPTREDDETAAAGRSRSASLQAWREPRTLLIGVFLLAFAFGEGAAGDWIAVALIDGHGAAAAIGTLGYAVFLAATTALRWFGAPLLDRYSRVRVLRGLAAVAITGLLLFIYGPGVPAALIGAALWGIGTAFGYPVAMSAGADDPRHAAARVTVISTIGKFATFAGPPLIGFLGEHITVLHALLLVAALQAVALVLAGSTRPLSSTLRTP